MAIRAAMLKRSTPLNSPQPQSSLRSVGLVTGLTFVQLLVQFAFQRLLARQFGAAAEMDAYVAALALPIVVSAVLAGSLGYVLVPVFAEQRETGGERAAAAVTSQIGLYLLAFSLAAAVFVGSAASPISAAMCPGFSAQQLALTIGLLRILALLVVANSLISFLNALHQCLRRFVLPVVAGIAGTLLALAYTWMMIQRQGIYAATWGVVLGAATTAAILLPPWLDQLRLAGAWRPAPSDAVRRCLVLLLPLLLGSLYWRLDPLLDRYLGSFLNKGSLAHLGYAWRLTGAVMLVGTSGLSIVAFPTLAAHAAAGRRADLCGEIAHAWRLLIVLLVPVTMGLGLFSEPVTRLLYQDGAFTAVDTRAVAWLIVLYLGVVIGASVGDVASRVSYALHDTRTPVLIGLVAFTVGAALKFLLVSRHAAAGLVLGTSAFYLFNAMAQTSVLLHRLGRDMLAGTGPCLLRSIACSAAACLAALAVLQISVPWAVLPAAAAGAAVYVAGLWLLNDEFAGRLLQPFQRSKPS